MSLAAMLPPDWREALDHGPPGLDDQLARLDAWLDEEGRAGHTVYPPREQIFAALERCPIAETAVVLLGQDPYHQPGQAHGLSFSVPAGVRVPPSLRNLFKELHADLGVEIPKERGGALDGWAGQGVLLLNTVLSVRDSEAASHKNKGWEVITDRIIDAVDARGSSVFLLLGAHAHKKRERIERCPVVVSGHPSPLSAKRHFSGSRIYSQVNAALSRLGRPAIDWSKTVPDEDESPA